MSVQSHKVDRSKSTSSKRRSLSSSEQKKKCQPQSLDSSLRRKSKQKVPIISKTMSVWSRNLLAIVIVFVFSAAFYIFFIRPYAYRWKPCNGIKGYGVCLPCNYTIHGIDISHYQGNIDWPVLSANRFGDFPIHFVFMKATEGGDHQDTAFVRNFQAARQFGFIRGAYHFFLPQTDARKQADFFIRTVPLVPGDLPPVLDVETASRKSPVELKTSIKLWLDLVERHYGVKPILYTSYKFKMRYLNDSIFDAYPYWIAHYYVDSVEYKGQWRFWQHTDAGTLPGIREQVDLNVFNGTLEELKQMTIPVSEEEN